MYICSTGMLYILVNNACMYYQLLSTNIIFKLSCEHICFVHCTVLFTRVSDKQFHLQHTEGRTGKITYNYNIDSQIKTRPFSTPELSTLNTQVAVPPFTGRRNIISCPPLWLLTGQDVVNIGRVNTGKLAFAHKDNSARDNVICVGSPARLDGQVWKVSSGREAHHMRRETRDW